MQSLLQELKTILAYERALYGPLVSLPEEESEEKAVTVRVTDDEPTSKDDYRTMSSSDLFTSPADWTADTLLSPYARIHDLIPTESPLHAMTTLAEVEAYVRETTLIPLDETRTNPVFGVGNPEADLLVVGEAPGADEDRQGEPFVGRAGQLLNKILEAISFQREDVYIANILKSRPPNNRDPLAEEIEAHVPILYKQMALIRPRLILCVGRTAGTTLLNKASTLGALRQKLHDFHGLPVLVTYHPAALLRNPQWKRPTWQDVQLLRRCFDEVVESAVAA